MINIATAIDRFSEAFIVIRTSEGSYDTSGNYVAGSKISHNTFGTVSPVNGNELKYLPEGMRNEAKFTVHTRYDLHNNDLIEYQGTEHRVLKVVSRRQFGFTKAIIGGLND